MKRLQKKHLLLLLVVLLFAAAAAVGGYFYFKYQQIKNNPNIVAQEETKYITSQIGKFIDVPKDEQPSLATITDVSKLKDQPFFKKAENGDKLIVYNKAQKAILYRPSENKIVDFTLVDTSQVAGAQTNSQGGQSPSPTTQPIKVVLYNGTGKQGLTSNAEALLTAQNTAIEIIAKANAVKQDYKKTLIINLSGNTDQANLLATATNGQISSLPDGEKKPANADFLIILGDDFPQ